MNSARALREQRLREIRSRREDNLSFLQEMQKQQRDSGVPDLGFVAPDRLLLEEAALNGRAESRVEELRRAGRSRAADLVSVFTLYADNAGILRWNVGPGFSSSLANQRRGRRGPGIPGDIVKHYKFADLPPNKIGQRLVDLDQWLTPEQGLFEVNVAQRKLGKPATPADKGKVLLLIHGTFSHSERLLSAFGQTEGRAFLRAARKHYDQILAFGHPTLSVSPVLNASDLARYFRGSQATVDIICHSRGGLVARWWREAFDPLGMERGKTIFVGSPLAGTSLAAPDRMKSVLELLANMSKTLSQASGAASWVTDWAAPLFTVSETLMQIVAMMTRGAARSPLLDAGVSLVPGLEGQSRHGANSELLRLRRFPTQPPATYFAIKSNFVSEAVGWQFWKAFRQPVAKLVDRAADFVFPGDNDLVVDTHSMFDLADRQFLPAAQLLDFETIGNRKQEVHHINYFDFPETMAFLHDKLGVPK